MIRFCLFIPISFLILGCQKYNDTCAAKDSPYTFQTVKLKSSSCIACHSENNPMGAGFDMTNYNEVQDKITCDAETSTLYTIITTGSMKEYSTKEINNEIKNWIKNGGVKGSAPVCKIDNSVYSFETVSAKAANNCTSCHYQGAPLSLGVNFDVTDYEQAKKLAICGEPNNSDLYSIITDGPMAVYSNPDINNEIYNWILNGMAESGGIINTCPEEDNSRYSFETVSTVIANNCASCHYQDAPNAIGAGLNITNYNEVRELIVCGDPQESKLYISIEENGPMENYSNSDIKDEIYNWILAGAPGSGGVPRCNPADVDASTYSFETVSAKTPGICKTCHSVDNAPLIGADFVITDYAQVKTQITCNPNTSPLYLLITGGSMKSYSTSEYEAEVENWILAGGAELTE
jgi:hypothetical protein